MSSCTKAFHLLQTPSSLRSWPLFPIHVGSNPKPFNMSLSTGSSITWLYSTLIPEEDRHGRNTYDPEASVPFRDHQNGISYVDGLEVSIDRVYKDEFRFGETTQKDHLVFRASSVVAQDDIGRGILMDGILALLPRYDANSTIPTVWAKLAAALPKPVFMVDFRFNDRGRYTFGEIPCKETDIRFWEPTIEDDDFWRLPITSYAIGGLVPGSGMAKKVEKTHFEAIVDTACSDLRLPSSIVQSYYGLVPNHIQQEGMHFFPPNQMLPDLFLYIGEEGYEVRIPGEFLKPQGPLHGYLSMGRLEESTNHGPILGHPFFFAQNVIFKGVDVLSVGLAKKVDS